MQSFTTKSRGQKITVICRSENTRNGFRHLAEIQINNYTETTAKCCYLNRTWERYTFESVIHKALDYCCFSADKQENEKRIKAIKRQIDHKALPVWAN